MPSPLWAESPEVPADLRSARAQNFGKGALVDMRMLGEQVPGVTEDVRGARLRHPASALELRRCASEASTHVDPV